MKISDKFNGRITSPTELTAEGGWYDDFKRCYCFPDGSQGRLIAFKGLDEPAPLFQFFNLPAPRCHSQWLGEGREG